MKIKDILGVDPRQYGVVGKQTYLTHKQYKSINAKKGGVINWGPVFGKRVKDGDKLNKADC